MADNSPVNQNQVKLAISALLAFLNEKKAEKKKNQLFESDNPLWLIVNYKNIPAANPKPKKIPLPHLLSDEEEICLFTKDPAKKVKEALEQNGITSIKKVISLTNLRKEYKEYQVKRQLANSFDTFLCDDRVYPMVIKAVGRTFFKRKRDPIPVRLTYSDWNTEISKCIRSTLLRIGHGPGSTLKVGLFNKQSEKELNENLNHAIKILCTKIPGGLKNIKSLQIKSNNSVALPIYQASPESLAPIMKEVTKKRKLEISEEKTEDKKENANLDNENTVKPKKVKKKIEREESISNTTEDIPKKTPLKKKTLTPKSKKKVPAKSPKVKKMK